MSHILIDGYNLIGIAHKDFEKARKDILHKLSEYANTRGHAITVVFDGWKNGGLKETRIKTANLTVIYSRLGDRADQVIMNMLSPSGVRWIVVSSDREISGFAEKKDFIAITSDEFRDKLYAFSGDGDEAGADYSENNNWEDISSRHRKLSKMEKRKIEALRKL